MQFEMFNADYVRRLTARDRETESHFTLYFSRFLSLKAKARRLEPEVADDVRQETLYRVLSILRQGGGVDVPERFGAFVNSVCNNVIFEVNRKANREAPRNDLILEQLQDPGDIHNSLISMERKNLVQRVLNDLPEKDREILRLVFFEERDRKEICRKFNVTGNYLRLLLLRAKTRFQAAYTRTVQATQVDATSQQL